MKSIKFAKCAGEGKGKVVAEEEGWGRGGGGVGGWVVGFHNTTFLITWRRVQAGGGGREGASTVHNLCT